MTNTHDIIINYMTKHIIMT